MEDLLNSLPDRFPSAEEPAENVRNEEAFGRKRFEREKTTWLVLPMALKQNNLNFYCPIARKQHLRNSDRLQNYLQCTTLSPKPLGE